VIIGELPIIREAFVEIIGTLPKISGASGKIIGELPPYSDAFPKIISKGYVGSMVVGSAPSHLADRRRGRGRNIIFGRTENELLAAPGSHVDVGAS